MKKIAKMVMVAIGVLSVSAQAATEGEKVLGGKLQLKKSSFLKAPRAPQDVASR